MAEADKLNIDSIIQRLLEGKSIYVCSLISIFGGITADQRHSTSILDALVF